MSAPVEALTLDDLEALAFKYGGFIEPHGDGFVLLGARIAGRLIDRIGPVTAARELDVRVVGTSA